MTCYPCGREFHSECLNPKDESACCCNTNSNNSILSSTKTPVERKEVGVSAGRKRAAKEYDLIPTASCEWNGLSNCGGGLHPIVGCTTGLQEARHHGPIKDTTHNEEGNVHKICTACHNLWHRRNDENYNEIIYSTLPHDPHRATPAELLTRGK